MPESISSASRRIARLAFSDITGRSVSTDPSDLARGRIAHGGRLDEARRLFAGAPEPFIDLSTGINPFPYPIPVLAREVYARLPEDGDIAALEAAAAATFGTVKDLVVAAPGSQLLISLLPRLLSSKSVAVVEPTYGEYRASWEASGAEIRDIATLEDSGDAEAVIVCNPNNPDGRSFAPAQLLAATTALRARGGLLVVDEAFADFEDRALSVIPLLPQPGVLVLRSFGKAYGLAGLRLGFAAADRPVVARIRTTLGPWPVSGPAVVIGMAALNDAVWREEVQQRLTRDVVRLDETLRRAGLRVAGGTKLFRLGEGAAAPGLFERLGHAGIFVRRFEENTFRLRFGLPPDEEAWRRLNAALSAR